MSRQTMRTIAKNRNNITPSDEKEDATGTPGTATPAPKPPPKKKAAKKSRKRKSRKRAK